MTLVCFGDSAQYDSINPFSLKIIILGSKTIIYLGWFLIYEKSGLETSNVAPLVDIGTVSYFMPWTPSLYIQAQISNTIFLFVINKDPLHLHSETCRYLSQSDSPVEEELLTNIDSYFRTP